MAEYGILDLSSGDPSKGLKKIRKSYWTVLELRELFLRNKIPNDWPHPKSSTFVGAQNVGNFMKKTDLEPHTLKISGVKWFKNKMLESDIRWRTRIKVEYGYFQSSSPFGLGHTLTCGLKLIKDKAKFMSVSFQNNRRHSSVPTRLTVEIFPTSSDSNSSSNNIGYYVELWDYIIYPMQKSFRLRKSLPLSCHVLQKKVVYLHF